MKIGTRVTLLTVLLVVLTLSGYGLISVRARDAELTSVMERQTQLFGSSLKVALEAALQEGLFEDVRHLIARMQAIEQPIQVVYLDLLHPADSAVFGSQVGKPGPAQPLRADGADASREGRLRRVQISGRPFGEHIELQGRGFYAYMVPLYDTQHSLVAVVDLFYDESDVRHALGVFTRNVALTVALLSVLLGLLVSFTVKKAFSAPLLRLLGGIDEVTRGDYTGAILREGNDELGILADRFNDMTRSLRQAREENLRSIDAKLQLEMRLRHSDKLATIGQLAAGIAHEVGTPLNVIGGRARAMARRSEDPAAVRKNAEIIADQAERITKIIQQLLDYARRKAPARDLVDVERIAALTLDFLEHQIVSAGVHATLERFHVAPPRITPGMRNRAEGSGEVPIPPPAAPIVMGDADQLQQVCLNLCLNAIQAMPHGGQLTLSIRGLVRRKPGLDRTPPGPYVMLEVTDTGVGIPEADRERIFEPFYSTKQWNGQPEERSGWFGGGLGLSVSAGIVKDHDGWIEIETPSEGGTTFRLYLPAPDADEQDLNEHGAASTQPKQDDERSARGALAAGDAAGR